MIILFGSVYNRVKEKLSHLEIVSAPAISLMVSLQIMRVTSEAERPRMVAMVAVVGWCSSKSNVGGVKIGEGYAPNEIRGAIACCLHIFI